nr:TolC family protein [Pseudomonas aeruginosa]
MAVTDLIPTEVAVPLLNNDPLVTSARSIMQADMQEAGIIRRSPYEWVATSTAQQRRVRSGPNYNEWNVGVERTIRLPGKTTADKDISEATLDESHANYGEARHAAAQELLALWLDWLAAEQTMEIADRGVLSARRSLDAVEKRSRAGDASRLDVNLAKAEMAELLRQGNEAKTRARTTWATLSNRFPGVEYRKTALPVPTKELLGMMDWHERVLAENDELRKAKAVLRKAQGLSQRAKAEKLPDPTVGVFTASEQGNGERLYGVSFSMPIPSKSRSARYSQALAQENSARLDAELLQRRIEADVARNLALATGAYDSYMIAKEGAVAMAENEAQMQRAYELGEAELQALLLARRQAVTAATSALQAQLETVRTQLSLLVDAHKIWNLDKDD